MSTDGSSKERQIPPPLRESKFFEWFILALVMFVSFLLSATVMAALHPQLGIGDLSESLNQLADDPDPMLISAFRVLQSVGQFFTFTVPALLFAFFVYRNRAMAFLHLNRFPGFLLLLLGALLLLFAFPLTQFTYWLNQQIPFPQWLAGNDELNQSLVSAFLNMETPTALYMNLLAMALLPALGEELLFRGVIQKLIGKMDVGIHKTIWFTAILFSAMHMEMAGFIPRLLLGALLGYLLYWTNSLWVPILAHFVQNAFQILAQYFYQNGKHNINLEEMDFLPIPYLIASVFLVVGLCYYLAKTTKTRQKDYESSFSTSFVA